MTSSPSSSVTIKLVKPSTSASASASSPPPPAAATCPIRPTSAPAEAVGRREERTKKRIAGCRISLRLHAAFHPIELRRYIAAVLSLTSPNTRSNMCPGIVVDVYSSTDGGNGGKKDWISDGVRALWVSTSDILIETL